MKTNLKNLLLLPALIALLKLLPAGHLTAQTFTALHSFAPLVPALTNASGVFYTNQDGANPQAGLIINTPGNTLYGTASGGGSGANGAVFSVNTDGTGFTNLHSFSAITDYYFYTNSDGANPAAGVILSGNILYGTANGGGSAKFGTVFALNTDGTGFTNLHNFNLSEGAGLNGLILSGSTLYGTAAAEGGPGPGTVFALNTDGTGFTNLYRFTARSGSYPDLTNSDGAYPYAALILKNNTLYGTASSGGRWGNGAVFRLNTDGTGFTNLHNFTAIPSYPDPSTNSDGARTYSALVLSGNTLYGTAIYGGHSGNGTVFAVNTDGTGFTNLHSFTAVDQSSGTNSDGANPWVGLVLMRNTLYGTTQSGGSLGLGTVFALNTDGTGFTTLYNFAAFDQTYGTNSDGAAPNGLILLGNTLYGTASSGGSPGNGTVFSLSFRPQLTITRSGPNVILTWPTNVAGFDYRGYGLQSTTNLLSPAFWSTNSPAPAIVNGQNAVTNPISGAQQFYRLTQ